MKKPTIKTVVINLIGSPGTGKSTTASGLFNLMKTAGMDVELVSEFAKDLVWEMRDFSITNQLYIFGKQHHRLFRLNEKVKYIITDSPLILCEYYGRKYNRLSESFKNLIIEEFNKYENINIFLKRVKKYNPKGRNQTEEESNEISLELEKLLIDSNYTYSTYNAHSKVHYDIFKELFPLECENKKEDEIIYISAPISKAKNVKKRLKKISKISATKLKNGEKVLCLTTLGFTLGKQCEELMLKDSQWWEEWYSTIIKKCDKVVVLMFKGWEESYGVQKEIELAKLHNIEIVYEKV